MLFIPFMIGYRVCAGQYLGSVLSLDGLQTVAPHSFQVGSIWCRYTAMPPKTRVRSGRSVIDRDTYLPKGWATWQHGKTAT